MAEKVIFEFEAPDGSILEWEGDENTPPEQVKAHFQRYLKSTQPPDSRSAAGVAASQTGQALKGAAMLPIRAGQFAWGAGKAAGETAGKVLEGDFRGAASRAGQGISDLVSGIADPFRHIGQLTGELITPGSQPGDIMDPERLAQTAEAAGTNAAGMALMTGPGKRAMQRNVAPQADTLMQKANRLRDTAPRPTGDPVVDMARTLLSGQSSPSVTVNVARAVKNTAKKPVAKGFELAARAKAALEREQPHTPRPVVEPNTIAATIPEEAPFKYEGRQPAAQGAPIDMSLPDETFRYEGRQPVAQGEPIDMAIPDETFQYEGRQPVAQGETVPFEFPEMAEPITAPTPIGKPTPAEVTMAEQALAPTGNQKRLSTIRNTPDLLEIAPELRGLPPGPQFDATLHQGFKNMEALVDAAEKSVPRNTKVSLQELKSDLLAVQSDYTLRAMPKAVAEVQRVIDKMNDRFGASSANVPWEDFIQVKRNLLKESRAASSTPLRRAYGMFMKATAEISPELSKANKGYSTYMRALENANMDPLTGRRIGSVGKPTDKPKSGPKPVGYSQSKNRFNLPL